MDEDIRPGKEWKVEIDTAIEECTATIVLITLKSLVSPYVTYEWSYALGKGKVVIPVILEMPDPTNRRHPKIHPKLQDRQYQFTVDPNDEDWEILITTLHELEEGLNIPPEVQEAELALRSYDKAVRAQAINTLRDFEHPTAEEALARAVESKHPDVSMNAGLALAHKTEYKNDRAIPGLERGIRTTNIIDFDEALRCLVRYRNERAVDAIILRLESNHGVKDVFYARLVKDGLCKIRHPHSTQQLIKILASRDNMDQEVIDALGNTTDPIVLPVLTSHSEFLATNLPQHVTRMNVFEAIAKIEHPDVPLYLVHTLRLNATSESIGSALFHRALDHLTRIGGEYVINLLTADDIRNFPADQHFQISVRVQQISTAMKQSND